MTRVKWQNIIEKEYINENNLRYEYLLSKFQQIKKTEIRELVITQYLFAPRISEICHYKQDKFIKKALRYEMDKVINIQGENIILKNKGDVIKKDGKTVYKYFKSDGLEFKGVTPNDFKMIEQKLEITKNGIKKICTCLLLQCTLRNEKNKNKTKKICMAPYKNITTGEYFEKELIDELMNYINKFKPDEEIFPKLRRCYDYYLKKYAPQFHYLHFLRALRCCVLLFVYNFNDVKLMDFMGWTDMRPLKNYKFILSLLSSAKQMFSIDIRSEVMV
jgi:hypothetical protein